MTTQQKTQLRTRQCSDGRYVHWDDMLAMLKEYDRDLAGVGRHDAASAIRAILGDLGAGKMKGTQ